MRMDKRNWSKLACFLLTKRKKHLHVLCWWHRFCWHSFCLVLSCLFLSWLNTQHMQLLCCRMASAFLYFIYRLAYTIKLTNLLSSMRCNAIKLTKLNGKITKFYVCDFYNECTFAHIEISSTNQLKSKQNFQ